MSKLNLFRNESACESYQAGQVIFEKGQPAGVMYAVKSGSVDIMIGEDTLETLESGEIFGEMALIDTSIRTATARARTDCEVVSIDENRFLFLVQQTPHFALEVMKALAQRLRRRTDAQYQRSPGSDH